ncbi:conserved membrane hypothetical protein [Hyella patelloides LEGE 07179]|uniref:Dolichol-phosphate mannosyltransferase n=1 Tax=Hyella patelloides LEGE 07179 TaxID=945734 RepID=A0A563VWU0_9CYAN|nr:dolichol-phosphate mannosyltransferase [Hyella patelloides]VEP15855.1 conserved membrane hypothetical protein [Hyella patelloides LEGE 07179]
MKLKSISLVIIFGGILFSLLLQGQVADGVYFSGDGGLKALLAKQLASGDFRFYLATPDVAWVRELWDTGLYPYDKPYVYQVAGKYYITFPYTFPLVAAPFYALFGYRGLYVIPLVSCWVIWLVFYLDCLKLKLDSLVTALGLICLIFGSYLTVYSAMYWEHTFALALAFTGLSLWFFFNDVTSPSTVKTIMSGILIGLSVWFRPEFICVVVIMIGLAIFTSSYFWWQNIIFLDFKQLQPILFATKQQLILVISTIVTVVGFFVTNKIIYGYAVGIHGIQVVESIALSDRLLGSWQNFTSMSSDLLEYLPIIIFPILCAVFYLIQRVILLQFKLIDFPIIYIIIYLAIIAFMIGVSLLVPVGTQGLIPGGKQWGVRFLLMLVPVIILLTSVQLQQANNNKIIKYSAIFIVVLLSAIGIHKNVWQATQILAKNNQETAPAVEFIQTNNNQYIVISHEFVGQSLQASTTEQEIFFTINKVPELIQFSQKLIEQQQTQFVYICYPHRACKLPDTKIVDLQFEQSDRPYQIQLNSLGKFGKYPIYQGNVIQLKK